MYPQRLWAFTDAGAVTWLQLIQLVQSQQATINALGAKVAKLETQLPAPKPTAALPGSHPATASIVSRYTSNAHYPKG